MLPQIAEEIAEEMENELEEAREVSRTYKLHTDKKLILGYTDGLDAMDQAIYKILNTERYRYILYSWDYGMELEDLTGRELEFVLPELERRIKEALMQDDRIEEVTEFRFEFEKEKITVTFVVSTIFGDYEASKEVEVSV